MLAVRQDNKPSWIFRCQIDRLLAQAGYDSPVGLLAEGKQPQWHRLSGAAQYASIA